MQSRGMAVSMVFPIMKTLTRKGCDPETFFREAAFDSRVLQDPEARIPDDELERLMLAAAAYTNDDYFGLHQGRLMDAADLGILGYVMMHSATVADALAAYQRYNVIVCSGFNIETEANGDEAAIRLSAVNPAARMSRQCIEDMACSLYHLMMKFSNRHIKLRGLEFTHEAPGADSTPYAEAFGLSPRFGSEHTVMRIDSGVLRYPIIYSDPAMLSLFESIADSAKAKTSDGKPMSDQVSRWMLSRLPAGFPTLEEAAQAFAMSKRTLQLKLQEEGTSFNELSARARMELAVVYLRKREYSIAEIAYLLHYSEPSTFQNAFKKWTGRTPGQYRAEAIAQK